MASRRVARVGEQIRREITEILRLQVRDPRIGMVTVTDVRVTPDLEQARIRVSVAGDADEQESSLTGLRAAAPYIRGELGRRMRIRRVPELRFELDDSLSHVRRIDELIADIHRNRAPETPGDPEREGDAEAAADPEARGTAGGDDVA
ncbi:MAG TPA: 30S ribosome-binding factor RbfA [Longimicrobiales bacterium]|nr:30S ribosome-binding factor RbfA [Longimicrobiales bacterium]